MRRGSCDKMGKFLAEKVMSGISNALSLFKRPFCGCFGGGNKGLRGHQTQVVPLCSTVLEKDDGSSSGSNLDELPSRLSTMEPEVLPELPLTGCSTKSLPENSLHFGAGINPWEVAQTLGLQSKPLLPGASWSQRVL